MVLLNAARHERPDRSSEGASGRTTLNVSQVVHPCQFLCLSSLYGITLNYITILRTASESVTALPEQPSMLMYIRTVAAAEEKSYNI